jgi:hypothetical protein
MHPVRVTIPGGYHLRPVSAADTDLDYPAVMGSQERLWSIFGDAWGWPPATMTYQQDRRDLARHEAEICWWIVDEKAGTELQRALDAFVRQWMRPPGL